MKKLFLLFTLTIAAVFTIAAPFKFLPYTAYQPDGTTIECFASGDEFFNWLHDADGYSIIKGSDGYYYYAVKQNDAIVPGNYRVNSVDPATVGLKKWVKISKEQYAKKKKSYEVPADRRKNVKAPHTGTLNNLVIYIRFAGETEIETTRDAYDQKLNGNTGESLKNYYDEVSYNQLNITSTHYPDCAEPSTSNVSYEDSHERSYFQPYDADNNPNGYDGDEERRLREHQLLVDAVTWINQNNPIPSDLNIDGDNDGYVDNVCFMINDGHDEWADLLWAHRWALWTYDVEINGKRVYDYTFQPENQVSVRTLCHEMFHALGAPDLYHYYEGTDLSPVGEWDIMEHGKGHMGAYMKWKYANAQWVTEIPEINSTGTYTLNHLSKATNNCFKVFSPNSTDEFFVLEYRKKEGEFENSIPGSGLLVYRINSNFDGNADFDFTSTFDEVYIYRPGGTPHVNGNVDNAYFSDIAGRTEINDETDPSCFLHDSTPGGLSISNVTISGETISFDVNFEYIANPRNPNFVAASETAIDLYWELNSASDEVLLAVSTDGAFGELDEEATYNVGDEIDGGGEIIFIGDDTTFTHTGLEKGTVYYYKLWSRAVDGILSNGLAFSGYTQCGEISLPYMQDFSFNALPACWIVNDNVGSGAVWEFNNPAAREFTSTSGENGFAILDSENYGSGITQNADLVTPVFDCSSLGGIKISFEHSFKSWTSNIVRFRYSTNEGENWTTLDTWVSDVGALDDPDTYETVLTEEIAGESSVQFAWNYNGAYGYYWIIDDIEISTDTVKPQMEIVSEYDIIVRENPFELEIQFSETIVDYDAEKILIDLGTLDTMYQADDTTFILSIVPQTPGEVTLYFEEDAFHDFFGNSNELYEYSIEYGWPLAVQSTTISTVEIFPNPGSGLMHINGLPEIENSMIQIFDISGKNIFEKMISGKNGFIDMSGVNPGLYFITISNAYGITNSKLIVK